MKVSGNVAGKGVYVYIDTECWLGPPGTFWITANSCGLIPACLHIQGRWIWIWSDLTESKSNWLGGECDSSSDDGSNSASATCLQHPPTSTRMWSVWTGGPPPPPHPALSVWLTSPAASHKIKNTSLVGRTCVFSPPPPPLGFKGERGGWADIRTGRDGRFYKRYGNVERDGHFYHLNILLRAAQPALATEREREWAENEEKWIQLIGGFVFLTDSFPERLCAASSSAGQPYTNNNSNNNNNNNNSEYWIPPLGACHCPGERSEQWRWRVQSSVAWDHIQLRNPFTLREGEEEGEGGGEWWAEREYIKSCSVIRSRPL